MPRHLHLEPHLTSADLEARYRGCGNPVERSHWHFLWLLARGMTATAVSRVTGYSAYWVGLIARRYNRDGPDGVRDRRHRAAMRSRTVLSAREHAVLRGALAAPLPDGDRWCGRTVAAWMGERLGRRVCRQTGWRYLRRVGARRRKPRPRHVRADPAAQAEFVARLRPLLRQVATAFPRARVELWAWGTGTNTASASNRSSGRCGHSTTPAHLRPSNTATLGAIWSASYTPPRAAPSSTWPRA